MDEFLKKIIKEAGVIALRHFKQGVKPTAKANLGDLLTIADLKVEEFLIAAIIERYPEHHIHSEELAEDINAGAEYEWVIDPIDGTRNFAVGIPFFAHLVAVMKRGEPFLAAIYNPVADQLFFAESGKGASLNGRPIKVNQTAVLDYCFGCVARNNIEDIAGFTKLVRHFNEETSGWLHNFGSVLSACYLAMGGIDFYAINCGYDHDYLAPTLIAREAGALVTNAKGERWQRGMRDIVMANSKLHSKVLELLR